MPLRFTTYRSFIQPPFTGSGCATAKAKRVPSGDGDGSRETVPAFIRTGVVPAAPSPSTKISAVLGAV